MLRSQLLRRLPSRHVAVAAHSAAAQSATRLVEVSQGVAWKACSSRTVVVPSMGESMTEGTIATVLKKSGDAVKTDDIIAQIETDKVTIDIRAPHDGVIQSLSIAAGDVVKPGQPVAELGAGGAPAAAAKPAAAAPSAPSAEAAGPAVEIVVPSMGDSISEGTVAAILKTPGSAVNTDDIVAQIETDKVTIDVRAPASGSVLEIKVAKGDVVKVGQAVAIFSAGAGAPAAAKPAAATASPKPAPAAAAPPPKPAAAPSPAPAAPTGARVERRIPMTKLRLRVAERLKSAQNTYALLTTFNEVDMSGIMELRNDYKDAFLEKHGVKLGFMSAFVKASVSALQEVPAVNGVIDGTDIVYRDYYDVSVAVGTAKGLVVPVLRNADKLSFAGIEKGIAALGKKARDGTLSVDDMAGGTFTISNGGVYGSLLSTPIVNPPQSAILGMHAIVERPVAVKGAVVIRPIMNVALTYDHRIIDGREAVTFLKRIKDVVEHPERLLLDL